MPQVRPLSHLSLNCTFREAWGVAADIKKNSSHVKDVIVFGSIARDLIGSSINLLIIVDEDDFKEFVKTLKNGHTDPDYRRANVAEILEFDEIYDSTFMGINHLDVWLVPADWNTHINTILALMPEGNRDLSRNIELGYRQPLA